MARIYTTSAPPGDPTGRLEFLLLRQRKQDSIQSAIIAIILLVMLCLILWLITIFPGFTESPVIVTYQAPPVEEENPVDRPDMARGLRPKPSSSSSATARVIAAAAESPVAVPVPEDTAQPVPFGMDDDYTAGFGAGDGDGDGGGGSSFFGTPRKGRRVAYLVDFSESMTESASGGSRIAALKKELVRSIQALEPGMNFSIIYFSHNAWNNLIEGPNQADKGWNGLNQPPASPWYPATDGVKAGIVKEINAMPPQGGTAWYPPVKMALQMSPAPDVIYLLSDGEPRDFDLVLDEMDEMNPGGIPIDTIALEVTGKPVRLMHDLAAETGGKFSLVHQGKLVTGPAAERYMTMD